MSEAIVESRRFRTWDGSRALEAEHRVRLLVAAQFMRYRSNWYFWVLIALGILFALVMLVYPFLELEEGGWVHGEALAMTYLVTAGTLLSVTTLLIGAPAVAEDLRFNAPLFYFSRPLRVSDYLAGKLAFLLAVMLLIVGPALVTTLASALFTIQGDGPSPTSWCTGGCLEDETERWVSNGITGFGDWLFLAFVLTSATVSVMMFLATMMLMVSSFTRRAWHAGIALLVLVGAWGSIGLGLGFVASDDAMATAFGPLGWGYAVSALPVEEFFGGMYWDDVEVAAFAGHLGLIAWSAVAALVVHWRMRRMEGAL